MKELLKQYIPVVIVCLVAFWLLGVAVAFGSGVAGNIGGMANKMTDMVNDAIQNSVSGANGSDSDSSSNETEETSLDPGLYDANDIMVASWDELTDTYGMDVTSDYEDLTESHPSNVLSNDELSTGVKLIISDDVTNIGTCAFANCTSLTKVIISDSVNNIAAATFSGCVNLTEVTIPNSITSIGFYAFASCTSLTEIVIPSSVTNIDMGAFVECTKLRSITIPSSVTNIGQIAFSSCTNLATISVDSNNAIYHSAGNSIIETESKTLVVGCKNSVILSDGSVTSIGGYAFASCTSLTDITIPNGVINIEEYAFSGCVNLTNVIISDSVTNIGEWAFYCCDNLASVTFENTNGWYLSSGTNLDVTDASENATKLKDSTYGSSYWYRSE